MSGLLLRMARRVAVFAAQGLIGVLVLLMLAGVSAGLAGQTRVASAAAKLITFVGGQTLAGASADVTTLARSTNGQTVRVYRSDDGAGNAEWLEISATGSIWKIQSGKSGTGSHRTIQLQDGAAGQAVYSNADHSFAGDAIMGNYAIRWSGGLAFASLGTPSDGRLQWCTDCTKGSSPCSGSGTGTLAVRHNSTWTCF